MADEKLTCVCVCVCVCVFGCFLCIIVPEPATRAAHVFRQVPLKHTFTFPEILSHPHAQAAESGRADGLLALLATRASRTLTVRRALLSLRLSDAKLNSTLRDRAEARLLRALCVVIEQQQQQSQQPQQQQQEQQVQQQQQEQQQQQQEQQHQQQPHQHTSPSPPPTLADAVPPHGAQADAKRQVILRSEQVRVLALALALRRLFRVASPIAPTTATAATTASAAATAAAVTAAAPPAAAAAAPAAAASAASPATSTGDTGTTAQHAVESALLSVLVAVRESAALILRFGSDMRAGTCLFDRRNDDVEHVQLARKQLITDRDALQAPVRERMAAAKQQREDARDAQRAVPDKLRAADKKSDMRAQAADAADADFDGDGKIACKPLVRCGDGGGRWIVNKKGRLVARVHGRVFSWL
jgi:hypothetical protein